MVPLVNWLNSYESIWTHFCCQGEPRQEGQSDDDYQMHRPYVLFTCISTVDLISVLSTFGYRADTFIGWNEMKCSLEYCTRFHDQQALFETIEFIGMSREGLQKRMIHGW